MPVTSLPDLLDLEVATLEAERAAASMGHSAEPSAGAFTAGAEWLVRQAVAARGAATTISMSTRLIDASAEGPYRLLAQRTYVGASSQEWAVEIEAGEGHVVARVEIALSLADGRS